jgi:malonate transporter MadL subunit
VVQRPWARNELTKEPDVVIYGVGLLSFCMLVGMFVGDLLGEVMGVQANVGGVGIAMILLLTLSNLGPRGNALSPITATGIGFWSAMYIPIVVAMAARQNVAAALSGGWMAIIAGVAAVAASFAMIPVLARFGQGGRDDS